MWDRRTEFALERDFLLPFERGLLSRLSGVNLFVNTFVYVVKVSVHTPESVVDSLVCVVDPVLYGI